MNLKSKILLIGASGYIGSYLSRELNFFNIETIDILNSPLTNRVIDAFQIEEDFLNNFEGVILLAGMSKVSECKLYPKKCFRLNTILPLEIRRKLNKDKFFIYASSGSLYNGSHSIPASEYFKDGIRDNAYDSSKFLLDELMYKQKKPFISLRFGTVNGFTSNWRQELVVNKMCYDAIIHKKITLSNPTNWRSILDIRDLGRAFIRMLKNVSYTQRVYNLGSFNTKIGEIAGQIQEIVNCAVLESKELKSTYSFSMSSAEFSRVYDFEFKSNLNSLILQILLNKNTFI